MLPGGSAELQAKPSGTGRWFRVFLALLILGAPFTLIRCLKVLGGLFLGPGGIVFGADRLVVLVHGAVALTADVVDLAKIDARPDFSPFRIQIAIQNGAKFVSRLLESALS